MRSLLKFAPAILACAGLLFSGIFRPNRLDPKDSTRSVDPSMPWSNPADPVSSNYQGSTNVDMDGDGLPDARMSLTNLSKTNFGVRLAGIVSFTAPEMQFKFETDSDWCPWTPFAPAFELRAPAGPHTFTLRLRYRGGKVGPSLAGSVMLNARPVSSFSLSNLSSFVKIFDARSSTDADDSNLLYAWDLDSDGVLDRAWAASNRVITNQFVGAGTNQVILWVRDGAGAETAATNTCVRVDYAPVASFIIVRLSQTNVVFDASSSVDAANDALEYAWDFNNDATLDLPFAAANRVVTNLFQSLLTNQVALFVRDHPAFSPNTNAATNLLTITNGPPTPSFWVSNANRTNKIFYATNSSDPDGNPLLFAWDFDDDGSLDVPWASASGVVTNAYAGLGTNNAVLWVRDTWNASNSASIQVMRTNSAVLVAFSAPPTNSLFILPSSNLSNTNVLLTASVSDPDFGVTNLSFFSNGILLGAVTSAPWQFTANLSFGTNLLTAIASSSFVGSNESAPISVIISNLNLPPGLTLWNKMGSDSELATSAFGPNLTRSGSLAYTGAVYGNGTEFTGSTTYASFPKTAINPSNGTIEFWFTPYFASSGITTYKGLFDTDGSGGTAPNRLLMCWNNSGQIDVSAFTSSVFSTTVSFSAYQTMHIAVVWDRLGIAGSGETARLYVDGVKKASTTYSVNATPSYSIVYLGHHAASFGNANGVIDNLKVFTNARTNFSDRAYE